MDKKVERVDNEEMTYDAKKRSFITIEVWEGFQAPPNSAVVEVWRGWSTPDVWVVSREYLPMLVTSLRSDPHTTQWSIDGVVHHKNETDTTDNE
jgi:hypothetical protein